MGRPDNLALGCIARDTISGFEGKVIAMTEWLNGCLRVTIQPQKLQDNGQPIDGYTFDAEQVEVVTPVAPAEPARPKGGPSISPTRARDPR